MGTPLMGLLVSAAIVALLLAIFRVEESRGRRFAEYVREHFDFAVLKSQHALHVFFGTFSRGVVRQSLHFIFHTLLTGLLAFVSGIEFTVKEALRSNRALARRSQRERKTRNKLDEIALHKIEVALSEEEKRRHKEKHLNGN